MLDTAAPVAGAVFGSGSATKVGVNTDCEQTGPHNETAFAVNPTSPLHMIAGANDYQLAINPGGHITASVLSRARVTTDGGRTWRRIPSSQVPPTKRPGIPPSHSTPTDAPITRLSATASSARPTRRTRTSSWRTPPTAVGTGPSASSPPAAATLAASATSARTARTARTSRSRAGESDGAREDVQTVRRRRPLDRHSDPRVRFEARGWPGVAKLAAVPLASGSPEGLPSRTHCVGNDHGSAAPDGTHRHLSKRTRQG